jgi:hypothetical protein
MINMQGCETSALNLIPALFVSKNAPFFSVFIHFQPLFQLFYGFSALLIGGHSYP